MSKLSFLSYLQSAHAASDIDETAPAPSGPVEWTDALIERLRVLWDEGLSASKIARRLRTTKNSVIGKAHRIKLPPRSSPILQTNGGDHIRTGRPPRSHKAKPKSELPLPAAAPTLAPLPALAAPAPEPPKMPDRIRVIASPTGLLAWRTPSNMASHQYAPERKCCWPLGELRTPEFRFCADWVTRPGPYCDEHRKLAYTSRAVVEADAA